MEVRDLASALLDFSPAKNEKKTTNIKVAHGADLLLLCYKVAHVTQCHSYIL